MVESEKMEFMFLALLHCAKINYYAEVVCKSFNRLFSFGYNMFTGLFLIKAADDLAVDML